MKQTKLINLTPYTINVSSVKEGIPASGTICRLTTNVGQVAEVNGIPILEASESFVTNMPQQTEGTMYIVPAVVRIFLKDRKDLLSPTKFLRDTDGRIVACAAFERNP
jgi:hypothetical protein